MVIAWYSPASIFIGLGLVCVYGEALEMLNWFVTAVLIKINSFYIEESWCDCRFTFRVLDRRRI